MNGTNHKKAYGELKAKYEDKVYSDGPFCIIRLIQSPDVTDIRRF